MLPLISSSSSSSAAAAAAAASKKTVRNRRLFLSLTSTVIMKELLIRDGSFDSGGH